jgi:exonuclease SbcC
MAELRLAELVVENFRSISGRCVIPLDGSITLVHGANGAGKTSLLSAIELAATGKVGFLEDQTAGSRSLLRNQDFPLGSVRLSLADQGEIARLGSFEFDGDRVVGKPALTPSEQTYFLERSFLPQTALGRLLDSYTESGKQVDTALVRFVKSLVGLDDLDALIEGLHASGDRRRSKNLVPAWARAADELAKAKQRRIAAAEQLDIVRKELGSAIALLRELVSGSDSFELSELLRDSVERGRGSESSRSELTRLEELQVTLDAVANLRSASGPSSNEVDQDEIDRVASAHAAIEAWESGIGASALASLNRIREVSLDLPAASIGDVSDAYEETRERVTYADRQHKQSVAAEQARLQRIEEMDLRIEILDSEIAVVEARALAIDVSPDIRLLLEIIRMTIPITRSERCPVCDEQFSGTGSLTDHLAAKLEHLSANATDLMTTEQELSRLREKRLEEIRQVILQKSLPVLSTGEPMDEMIRTINGLGDSIDEGNRLRRELQSAQADVARATAHSAERAVRVARVAEIARALGLAAADLPAHNPELELGREIAARVQRIRFADIQRQRERDAREAIEEAQRDTVKWEGELRESSKAEAAVETQLSTAESRMARARDVLQVAERTRSKLINEVFDQSLNSVWAQLFGRFAPTERFTPRFVKQTESSRSVDVSLETELPGGTTSGSPGAMLSYGNTNSAALALFMALNLSAPSELQWLVFDDPVQSMDDIHVANFAAIVRQLAFVHKRQIVIAIHQPELFEYLSLELAPSDSSQSLVRVSLDRGAGTTNVTVDRVEYAEEQPLQRLQ